MADEEVVGVQEKLDELAGTDAEHASRSMGVDETTTDASPEIRMHLAVDDGDLTLDLGRKKKKKKKESVVEQVRLLDKHAYGAGIPRSQEQLPLAPLDTSDQSWAFCDLQHWKSFIYRMKKPVQQQQRQEMVRKRTY